VGIAHEPAHGGLNELFKVQEACLLGVAVPHRREHDTTAFGICQHFFFTFFHEIFRGSKSRFYLQKGVFSELLNHVFFCLQQIFLIDWGQVLRENKKLNPNPCLGLVKKTPKSICDFGVRFLNIVIFNFFTRGDFHSPSSPLINSIIISTKSVSIIAGAAQVNNTIIITY
jgi:hypothetical protein